MNYEHIYSHVITRKSSPFFPQTGSWPPATGSLTSEGSVERSQQRVLSLRFHGGGKAQLWHHIPEGRLGTSHQFHHLLGLKFTRRLAVLNDGLQENIKHNYVHGKPGAIRASSHLKVWNMVPIFVAFDPVSDLGSGLKKCVWHTYFVVITYVACIYL